MTFDNFIKRLAPKLGKNADATRGTVTLTDLEKADWTAYANEAMADLWTRPEWCIWPWIMDSASPTVTSSQIATSAVAESDLITAWTEDPREKFKLGQSIEYLRLNWARDESDKFTLGPKDCSTEAVTSAFVFFRIATPVWVWTGGNTSQLPDVMVPVVEADVLRKVRLYSNASQSEAILAKVQQDYQNEYDKLVMVADRTWAQAPWLINLQR